MPVRALMSSHAGLQHAGEHLEEAQTPDERVGHGLEHECGGALGLVDADGVAARHLEAPVAGRMREVRADVFHDALHALLDDGGSHEHGNEQLLRDGLVQKRLQLLLRELLLAVQVLHHELVVGFGHQVAKLVARVLRHVGVFGRDVLDALGIAALVKVARLHADDVDDALEVGIHAYGDGDRPQTRAEARVQRGHGRVEVGVLAVDVVDVHGARQAHVLGFAPQLGGHHLWPGNRVHHEERHFGRLHGGQRVADEVGMARRVQKVDLEVLVGNGSEGRADGELALDLFGIVVQVGLPVVRGAHAGRFARDVEHGLGERGLAGSVLADEDNVAHVFGSRSCHVDHQLSCCVAVPFCRIRGTNHFEPESYKHTNVPANPRKPLKVSVAYFPFEGTRKRGCHPSFCPTCAQGGRRLPECAESRARERETRTRKAGPVRFLRKRCSQARSARAVGCRDMKARLHARKAPT